MPTCYQFLEHRTFACDFTYAENGNPVYGPPRYQFNCLENLGNALLYPLALTYRAFPKCVCVCKVIILIIGIVPLIFAFLGLLVKKGGECCNSLSTQRLELLEQVYRFEGVITLEYLVKYEKSLNLKIERFSKRIEEKKEECKLPSIADEKEEEVLVHISIAQEYNRLFASFFKGQLSY